jgi:hypothetical protein
MIATLELGKHFASFFFQCCDVFLSCRHG